MFVLAVTSRCPLPPDRGDTRRLVALIADLARRHDVECVVPDPSPAVVDGLEALGVGVGKACFVPWATASWWRGPAQVAAMARFQVDPAACRAADVIHVSTLRSLAMVPPRYWPKVHLDFVDALSRNALERAGSSGLGPLWRMEARSLATAERRAVAAVGAASASSAEDAAALGADVHVLPVGTDVPEEVPPRDVRPTIAFTGNLGYFANIDAAKWLATDIFPRVRDRIPDARLVLAGARPAADVLRLGEAPGVEVHADVPSLTPVLGSAWVACAPLRYGTGVQFKVLEAAAHGRAVVTTSRVASRLSGLEVGRHLLTADTAEDVAGALVQLIDNTGSADLMGRAAREAVRRNYSWPTLAAQLEATLTGVAGNVATRPA